MAKLTSLIEHAQRQRAVTPSNPTADIASIILASQTAMADVITRNFSGEISDKVKSEVAGAIDGLASRVEAAVMARVGSEIAKAIEAMPKPEVAYYPEPEREEEPEEVPKPIMVQRKDGMISGVKVGEVAYDVVRNKAGLIKEVRPRA